MKNYKNPLIIFFVLIFVSVNSFSQIGTGYYNGAVFNTYTDNTAGVLSGNNFSISYSVAYAHDEVTSFTPGTLPANTGFPATNPSLLNLKAGVVNAFVTFSFTSDLPKFATLYLQDVDKVGSTIESVKVEFLNSGGTLISTSNILIKTSSTTGLPSITTNATDITVTGTTTSANEPLIGLTITSTTVRTVRITELSSASTGSYEAFFGIQPVDHGDAPAGYGDAQHLPSSNLRMGSSGPDAEGGAQNSANADGDNAAVSTSEINDEDGIASFTTLATSSTSYSVNVNLSNTTGSSATLYGWIDFNRNGVFDAGERSAAVTVANNATSATVNWTGLSGLVVGKTYARFRLASASAEAASATGAALTGEVEDYTFNITSTLPLSFTGFSAKRNGDNILASWQTESEMNVNHFEVEYSTDATSFINGGTVAAENGAVNHYQFTLTSLTQPLCYIRIKSVDMDGTFKYSSIAIVKRSDAYTRAIAVTPNPGNGNIMIHLTSDLTTSCSISVINPAGLIIYKSKTDLIKGENQAYINTLSNIAKGTYIIQVIIGGQMLTKQIIVIR